jgi:tetratricopeptide (TPR) repeat protein
MLERLSSVAVLVHVNSDKPEVKVLRTKYHVKGLPTVIFFDPSGQEAARILGYDGRTQWTRAALGYLYGVDTLQDLLAREKDSPNRALENELAHNYLDRGDSKSALDWVEKAKASKPAPDDATMAELDLTEGVALLDVDAPKGLNALGTMAENPSNPMHEEAYWELMGYQRKQVKLAKTPEEKALAQKDMMALYHRVMPARQNDPSFLNDYAWHCAEEKVELNQALAAAKKAVELSKEDPGILDTLAEVYFTMGNIDEAVQTIDKAIAQKPDDKYYKDQRAKFLKVDGDKVKG